MNTSKIIHIVCCHAEGEVGDVIVGGVAPPPGDTLWEQRDFIAEDDSLRRFVLNEPRGGVFRHVNLLVPPKDPRAQMGFIIVDGKLIYGGSSGIRVRDVETGKLIWQAGHGNAGYQNAIPVVWDDILIANGEHLRAFNLSTGKEVWRVLCAQDAERFQRSRRQSMAGSSTPVIAGDLAWFGHDDGSVRAVDKNGNVAWERRVGVPIKTSPVVTGNLVLVHDFAGNPWCFAGTAGN